MHPDSGTGNPGYSRRARPYSLRTDRHRQNRSLSSPRNRPPGRREPPRRCDKLLGYVAYTRTGTANRQADGGVCLLPANQLAGHIRRYRRRHVRPPATRPENGCRRGDCHTGAAARPHPDGLCRPFACVVLHPRRGRPHARHGFLRRHNADCETAPGQPPDAYVLGHDAP